MSFEFEQTLTPAEKINGPGLVSRHSVLRDGLEILILIAIVYTLVNLATSRYEVVGPSMQPNFYTGEHIIVNRFLYYFDNPTRGDVVVLLDPQNKSMNFIKRLIGLPGEKVEIKEGRVYINNVLLDEPYIHDFCLQGCDGNWTLKADEYFVLGDNRPVSFDSHIKDIGPIRRDLIIGQAWIVYWPLSDVGLVPHPTYLAQ